MTRQKTVDTNPLQVLRAVALRYPDAEEGIACKGTALERSTFKAKKKTFLFLGSADVRLKLSEALPEATALATKEPDRYKVGALGWVTVIFEKDTPPVDRLTRWIDESYRILVAPTRH